MASHTPKCSRSQDLQQDLIKQEWALLCPAIHAKKVETSELEDQLVRIRYSREYRGL